MSKLIRVVKYGIWMIIDEWNNADPSGIASLRRAPNKSRAKKFQNPWRF